MMLSQVVLLPLLGVFTWGYLALRPASPHRRGLAVFDGAVILAAILASLTAVWGVHHWYASRDHGIWVVVMSTVATFHVFPAVLLLGWVARRRLFGQG